MRGRKQLFFNKYNVDYELTDCLDFAGPNSNTRVAGRARAYRNDWIRRVWPRGTLTAASEELQIFEQFFFFFIRQVVLGERGDLAPARPGLA